MFPLPCACDIYVVVFFNKLFCKFTENAGFYSDRILKDSVKLLFSSLHQFCMNEIEDRTEADLHRIRIGQVIHDQYEAMKDEFTREMRMATDWTKGDFQEMGTFDGMIRAQLRPFPEIAKQYLEDTKKLNDAYGDPYRRGWQMQMVEAQARRELIENTTFDLGLTRTDERAEAPEREVYSFAYSYDGRKLIHDLFQERLRENRNLVVLFTGKTGGGKSYASLSIADFLTPSLHVGFEMQSLVYDIPSFIQRVRTQEPGTAIILDEAGISAGSRDALSRESKSLGKTIQSIRYLKHCTIFTLPNANFLDKQVRLLVDVVFDHVEQQKQGEFTPMIPVVSEDGKDVILHPFTIGRMVIRSVYFPLPRPSLIDDYEKTRKNHNMKQLADLESALRPEEKIDRRSENGKNPNSIKNLRPFQSAGKFIYD